MPEQEILLDYSVEIDREKTRQGYARAGEWECQCGDCRNFVALAKERQLPGYVLEILARLSIPPEKATYVGHLTGDGERHLYQFSYRVAGRILREPHCERIPDGRCCHEPYPYGAPDFPQPHFDVEFYASLPWILAEPRE